MSDPVFVKQTGATTCGQCVIAMLMDIGEQEAITLIGHDGITSDEEIWQAAGTASPILDGKPPKGVVAVQKHRDPKGEREHWTLWWKHKTLDPANIGKRLWPVSKYFIVDWAE